MLHSHNHDTYTYACGNKINNNDERTHIFRKIHLSHFIRNGCKRVAKGLCVRSELDTEQTATYWPPVPLSLAELLSRSTGDQPGVLRARSYLGVGSHFSILSPTNWIQLTEPVCGSGLYNCLTSLCFLWASHLHPIQPVHSQGYILISSTGCTCSLIDGWVEGQYVTGIGIGWVLPVAFGAAFTSARFSLTANVSHGTLYFLLCLIGINSGAASKWALTKFSFIIRSRCFCLFL